MVSFNDLPSMPKQKAVKITSREMEAMNDWNNEVGQSVRLVTVRNFSTKEKPGTLPYWVYELEDYEPTPYTFDPSLTKSPDTSIKALLAKQSSPLELVLDTHDGVKVHHTLFLQTSNAMTFCE